MRATLSPASVMAGLDPAIQNKTMRFENWL